MQRRDFLALALLALMPRPARADRDLQVRVDCVELAADGTKTAERSFSVQPLAGRNQSFRLSPVVSLRLESESVGDRVRIRYTMVYQSSRGVETFGPSLATLSEGSEAASNTFYLDDRTWQVTLTPVDTVPKTVGCPDCNGSGKCSACTGSGHAVCQTCQGSANCTICGGSGYCPYCAGAGCVKCGHTGACGACAGSGRCAACNGQGWRTLCATCGGSGRCPTCGGTGRVPAPAGASSTATPPGLSARRLG
ncbi:MAG TPA: hypothetical protein VGO93_01650 [Candidatus Xenobia bacterium]|jgi:hypothetical protein